MHPSAVLCTIAALAASASAQGLQWDVPHRGALVYDRKTERFEITMATARLKIDWLVKNCEDGGQEWRYFSCPRGKTPTGFEGVTFDDQGWATGKGLFGTDVGKDPNHRTSWTSDELCLRAHVDLGRKKPLWALFRIHHDDGVRVWWNGKLVVSNDACGTDRLYPLGGVSLDAWQRGDNVLAVQCSNTAGAQYLDVGLGFFPALPPTIKTTDDLLKLVRAEQAVAQRCRGDLIAGFRPPPLLLQGELDSNQERVRMAPADLRELAWFAAMDLSRGVLGGPLQVDSPRMYRLGDLQLKGRVSPVQADGWQDLDLQVKNLWETLPRDDTKRFVDRHVKPHIIYGLDARLRVRRRLQLADGKARVVEFHTELDGRVTRPDGKEIVADLRQVENWFLTAVRDNQDPEFRAAVRKAIDKGCEHLRADLAKMDQGDLARQPDDADRSYNSGRLALGLLALIKGHVNQNDELVQKGLVELRQRKLVDTYSLGNALMALETFYAPPKEIGDLRAGVIDRPRRRLVPAEDFALLQQWTARLLNNVDTRTDPAFVLRFFYTRGEGYDNSNNQYGLLGLFAAHLCGVDIPASTWEAAANHLIATQVDGKHKLDLDLVDYRTFARAPGEVPQKRTAARLQSRVAGWYYNDPKSGGEYMPIRGSMTCAGITGLSICQAVITEIAGARRGKLLGDIAQARNSGFAWLAENLQTRYHPGDIELQNHWLFYYLYGLERAALISGIALIQDRDWYFEGAMVLTMTQAGDGTWPGELYADASIERNAMAILFLKQSTLPVLSGQ